MKRMTVIFAAALTLCSLLLAEVKAELVPIAFPITPSVTQWTYFEAATGEELPVFQNTFFEPDQFQVEAVDGYFLGVLEITAVPPDVTDFHLLTQFGVTGDLVSVRLFSDEAMTNEIVSARIGAPMDHLYDFGTLALGEYYIRVDLTGGECGEYINFSISSESTLARESQTPTPEPASCVILGIVALCGLGATGKKVFCG